MIDRKREGLRCSLKNSTLLPNGETLRRGAKGTIIAEYNNLDRDLIYVLWDNEITSMMFPDDLEVFSEEER